MSSHSESGSGVGQPLLPQSSQSNHRIIFASLWLGSFLAAADSTVVTTINTTIMSEFNNASLLSWLGASYFAANAWAQPLCGQMSDLYSSRLGLIYSILIFAVGNLLCGIARSAALLVAGRFVAGVGGGAFIVITTIVANDTISTRSRGVYQGINNVIYALGHSSGGIISAVLAEKTSWQWSFYSLVILSVVTGLVIWTVMPIGSPSKTEQDPPKADYLGALLLSLTTGLWLLTLNGGLVTFPLSVPRLSLLILASSTVGIIFIRHELFRATHPILPLRLLTQRSVLVGCVVNFCACFCFTISEFFLPIVSQLNQPRLGISRSAIILLPLSAGGAAGSLLAGIILLYHNSPRIISGASSVCVILSSIAQALQTSYLNDEAWLMMIATFVSGLGFGGLVTSSLVSVLQSLPGTQISARATSLLFTFRSFGCALGLSIASLVSQGLVRSNLKAYGSGLSEHVIQKVLDSPLAIASLEGKVQDVVRNIYYDSLGVAFYCSAAVAMVGLLVLLFR